MDLYITDTSFNTVAVIDATSSTIWSEKYAGSGDFEIYVPASDKYIDVLREDYYIFRPETDKGMIIRHTNITTDVENGNYLTVTGKSLESILARRIVWMQTSLSGKVEVCIRRLIHENIINPTITARKIDKFRLGPLKGFTETMKMQVTGKNLQEVIDEICKKYGFGYKITVQDGYFVFDLYKGVDRSYNQTENPYVVFSPEFENLLNSDYDYNAEGYKNVVLVAGEGEGLARKVKAVGSASGLNRYEMYSDARDASTNNGEISDDEYYEQLAEDGAKTLAENNVVETFTGTVDYLTTFKYGEDYYMGDIVQVVNEYGISSTPRIIETIEYEDENGYSLIPTFEYLGGA